MNKTERKRQITIERHSITIIRINSKSNLAYCQKCQTNVTVFSPEQVSEILQTSLSEVYLRIDSGEFHLANVEGVGCVCGNSFKELSFDNSTNI